MGKHPKVMTIAFVFLLLCSVSSSRAQWIGDGTAVCTDTLDQRETRIATDGAGGAIIAWCDGRNGNDDIYAQRIDADGYVLWISGGVAICTALETQDELQIISDGAGGAIITWRDYRSGSGSTDIYAQKINAAGMVRWTADGVAICTETGYQTNPRLASDGTGGAIITWRDDRDGSTQRKIYAQRINTSGSVRWVVNGVGICTAMGVRYMPGIIPDGDGGAFIAWQDARMGGENIYAQRVDSLGNAHWTADGVLVCAATGNQKNARLVSDGAGGAIITWWDYRSNTDYDIYAQRIDPLGNVLWTTNGVSICTAPTDQYLYEFISDGLGGAIFVWQDHRFGDSDVYAQKVDSLGNVLWTTDGTAICVGDETQWDPRLATDGAGGAIITWYDYRSSFWDIYAQHVDADSVVQWTSNGAVISAAAEDQESPQIVSDGAGGAIITWEDYRNGTDFDIYARRINDYLVPTLLDNYVAEFKASAITITWRLNEAAEGITFSILKKEHPGGVFQEITNPLIEQAGLLFYFTDRNFEPGKSYRYRVVMTDAGGEKVLFETDKISIPAASLRLDQNFPNPFNPVTAISFVVPEKVRVCLSIHDLEGRLVKTLLDGVVSRGFQKVFWNGTDVKGNPASSGIYLYRLKAGDRKLTKKMLLLK